MNLGDSTTDIINALNRNSIGRDALKTQRDYHVTVSYTAGGGSYYDPDKNTVYIDQTDSDSTDAIIVREMTHAQAYQSGSSPNTPTNRTKLSRADYVQGMLNEKANALTDAITYNKSMPGDIDRDAKKIYEEAYRKARASVLNNAKPARVPFVQSSSGNIYNDNSKYIPYETQVSASEAGVRAGRFALFDALKNGTLLTSTKEKYSDVYGALWDYYNPPQDKRTVH